MPQRSTYFTDEEVQALEHLAERNDDSFSGVVRKAVNQYYDIEGVMQDE